MNNELMRYSSGDQPVPWRDRRVSKHAKAIYDEVRTHALQVDGALALSGHIMEGIVALDERRQSLAQGDPTIAAMLMDIEANTIRQAKNLQNSLFSGWNL
jgi:hypothetical protein